MECDNKRIIQPARSATLIQPFYGFSHISSKAALIDMNSDIQSWVKPKRFAIIEVMMMIVIKYISISINKHNNNIIPLKNYVSI